MIADLLSIKQKYCHEYSMTAIIKINNMYDIIIIKGNFCLE